MQTDLPVRGCYVKGGVAHKVLVIDVSPVANEQLCMFHMTVLTRLRGRNGKKYICVKILTFLQHINLCSSIKH